MEKQPVSIVVHFAEDDPKVIGGSGDDLSTNDVNPKLSPRLNSSENRRVSNPLRDNPGGMNPKLSPALSRDENRRLLNVLRDNPDGMNPKLSPVLSRDENQRLLNVLRINEEEIEHINPLKTPESPENPNPKPLRSTRHDSTTRRAESFGGRRREGNFLFPHYSPTYVRKLECLESNSEQDLENSGPCCERSDQPCGWKDQWGLSLKDFDSDDGEHSINEFLVS